MTSLIAADNHFAVWAALIGIAAFGFWCESYAWGRKYSGVMLLISLAIVLSNLRIIPSQASAYDAVWTYLVPAAIPLLLFEADLRRIFREAGKTLLAFFIGAASVVVGVFVAIALIDLGPQESRLAGLFAGTYIGGALNFAAVAEVTQFADESLLIAALAADNVITNLHILLIVLLPGMAAINRWIPDARLDSAALTEADSAAAPHVIKQLDVAGLLGSLALAFALAALGAWLAGTIERPQYAILVTTLLALAIATFAKPVVASLSGYREAGNALLFLFLAAIGASADVWKLVATAPILFVFALLVVGIHLLLLLTLGRLLRLGLAEMCIASAVCIGGPASGPAIAAAKGWRDLVIPGVLAGSFGYAVGSFVGVSVYEMLS